MSSNTLAGPQIRRFDPKSATQQEWAALNAFRNRMLAERQPDDPPETLEKTISQLSNYPPFFEIRIWAAWQGDAQIVGTGFVGLVHMEENKHVAQFDVEVLPEFRRQGLGTELLRIVTDAAHDAERRLMVGRSYGNVPEGEAFLSRIGAKTALATHTNQLDIAELDRDLIRQWQDEARTRASGFELGLWEGPYPEADIEEIAGLKKVINDAPHGDLEVEDIQWTPEHLRQMEESYAQSGTERRTMYVREKATGKLAGYTDIYRSPQKPTILEQGDTGVLPEYRGHGLGRWLKSAMLEKVLGEWPGVKYIRTGNADANAAMLKINNELGFKPYRADTMWQVEVDRVLQYLA